MTVYPIGNGDISIFRGSCSIALCCVLRYACPFRFCLMSGETANRRGLLINVHVLGGNIQSDFMHKRLGTVNFMCCTRNSAVHILISSLHNKPQRRNALAFSGTKNARRRTTIAIRPASNANWYHAIPTITVVINMQTISRPRVKSFFSRTRRPTDVSSKNSEVRRPMRLRVIEEN